MLIFGGLMLNLVPSGMLLRPIKVKPASNSKTAPIQKSPAISLKSSSEKESAKSCLNGSSHFSNGIPKTAPFPPAPPTPQVDTEKQGSPCAQEPQEQSVNPELSKLVLSGGEAPQDVGSCKPTDGSAELSGDMNGLAVAACPPLLGTQSEMTTTKAKLLDFSLLKDPFFCIYTWSVVFSQLAYFIPYFHLSARARTLDIDAMDASFIISVAGESSTSTHVSCKEVDNQTQTTRMFSSPTEILHYFTPRKEWYCGNSETSSYLAISYWALLQLWHHERNQLFFTLYWLSL